MSVARLRAVHERPGVAGWLARQSLRSLARAVEWTTKLPGPHLNLSTVTDGLCVGGAVPRARYPQLAALGITGVIDLRAECSDDRAALRALGIELLHLPAPDRYPPGREQLMEGVRWGLPRLLARGRLFVHCEHGVGRGPLMGLSLMIAQGWDAIEAYRHLRRCRWQATLNDRQLAGLADFAEAWAAAPLAAREEPAA
jgi:hypothetical protein